MTDIFSRPISHVRLIGNVITGILLAAILASLLVLVFIESAERRRRHEEATAPFEQSIPFKE